MIKTRAGDIIVPGRFLRLGEVRHLTGLSTSTIYAMVAAGTFPKNFKLTSKIVGWLERDIAAWQRDRIKERDGSSEAA
jgi:prophage regulatory protein